MGYVQSFNEIEQWLDELRRNLSGAALVSAVEQRIAHETDYKRLGILNWFLANEHMARGRHDAADAVLRRDRTGDVYRWYEDWRQSDVEPDIVAAIEARIRSEAHPERLKALRHLLTQRHRDLGEYD